MKADKFGVIAAGKVVKPNGMLPHRVVLRVFKYTEGRVTEFVVHNQGWLPDGKVSFSDGSYFPVLGTTATAVMTSFEEAYARFQERDAKKVLDLDFKTVFGWEVEVITEVPN